MDIDDESAKVLPSRSGKMATKVAVENMQQQTEPMYKVETAKVPPSRRSGKLAKVRNQPNHTEHKGIIVKLDKPEMMSKFKDNALANMIDLNIAVSSSTKNNNWNHKNSISGLSSKFTRRYIEYIDKGTDTVCLKTLRSEVQAQLQYFKEITLKLYDDEFIVNNIMGEEIKKENFDRLFSKMSIDPPLLNFMFKIMNIKIHIHAKYLKSTPDFFVSNDFMSKLLGNHLTKFDTSAVASFSSRSPFKNLFTGYRKVFFPVNKSNNNWSLIEVDFTRKSMTYFDLMPTMGGSCFGTNNHPVKRLFKYMTRLAQKQHSASFFSTIKEWDMFLKTILTMVLQKLTRV